MQLDGGSLYKLWEEEEGGLLGSSSAAKPFNLRQCFECSNYDNCNLNFVKVEKVETL